MNQWMSSTLEYGLNYNPFMISELTSSGSEDLGINTVPHRHLKMGNVREEGNRRMERFRRVPEKASPGSRGECKRCVWGGIGYALLVSASLKGDLVRMAVH